MSAKTCISCEAALPSKAKFCNVCGKNQSETENTCPYCKKSIPKKRSKAKFCPNCGKRIGEGTIKMKVILAPEGKNHDCSICRQEIEEDLVFCPNCINSFHFPHIAMAILDQEKCPMCKTKLIFAKD